MRKVPSEFLLPLGIVNIVFSSIKGYALVPGKSAFQLKAIRMLLITFRPKYVGLAFFSLKIFLNNCRYNIACFKSVVRQ